MALLGAAVLLSWAPFRPEFPLVSRSGPVVAEGVTTFDGTAALVGPVGMDWIAEAVAAEQLRVTIEARTEVADQDGPARLLSVSDDVFAADLMVGQDGDDLVVRVRRPKADQLGEPDLVVDDVFATADWHRIELDLQARSFRLSVDGVERRAKTFDEPLFADWERDQHTSVGDEWAGNRGWRGDLRRLEVATGAQVTDLTSPGTLTPVDDVIRLSRTDRVDDPVPADPIPVSLLRALAWAVLAAVVTWTWPHRLALVGLLLAPFVLTVGKLFIAARDPVLADAVLGLIGVVVGAGIARNRPVPGVLLGAPSDPDVIDLASRRPRKARAKATERSDRTDAGSNRSDRAPEDGADVGRGQPGR